MLFNKIVNINRKIFERGCVICCVHNALRYSNSVLRGKLKKKQIINQPTNLSENVGRYQMIYTVVQQTAERIVETLLNIIC